MSVNRTPVRTPLREIKVPVSQTPKNDISNLTPCKVGRTPKTSPGPALLLAIRLSAKKELLKNPPLLEFKDKENCAEEKSSISVSYFRNLLSSETERITKLCNKWEDQLTELESDENKEKICDAILGDMRTTVGQGRLIMRERFHQFRGLVDNCEFGTGEKPVTCQDLQGFWDMIYFQVEDVDAKFELLNKCHAAGWNSTVLNKTPRIDNAKKILKRKPVKKGDSKSSEAAKKRREEFAKKRAEARKRLAAAKAEMKQAKGQENIDNKLDVERVTFDAGFFKVDSPIKSPHINIQTPSGSKITPRSSSLRKQTCTPGSITKSLSLKAASKASPLVFDSSSKQSQNMPNSGTKPTKLEISKKLEFAGNKNTVVECSTHDEECVVEILLDGSEQAPDESTVSSPMPLSEELIKDTPFEQSESFVIIENTDDEIEPEKCEQVKEPTALKITEQVNCQQTETAIDQLALDTVSEKDVPVLSEKIKNLDKLVPGRQCILGSNSPSAQLIAKPQLSQSVTQFYSPFTSNQSKADFLSIDISPPTPFCNESGKSRDENVPHDVTTTSSNLPKSANSNSNELNSSVSADKQIVHQEVSEMEANDKKNCDLEHKNQLEISPADNDEVNEVKFNGPVDASENRFLQTNNDQSPACEIVDTENTDEEASNLSIFIDETTRNIEKMSEILCPIAETPQRATLNKKNEKSCQNNLSKPPGTPPGPTQIENSQDSPNKLVLQAELLDAMNNIKLQMETLQKLNLNYLKTPNKQSEVEQLRGKVESLESEKIELQKILENERKQHRLDSNMTDVDNLRRLAFKTEDELDQDDDSNNVLYKPHYFRLLSRVKILEAQLKAYNDVQPDLMEVKEKITNTFNKLNEKANDLKCYGENVRKQEQSLKKSIEKDNKELKECREVIQNLKSELGGTTEELTKTRKLSEECSSNFQSIQQEFDLMKIEKDKFETTLRKLDKENICHVEENVALQEKLEIITKQLEEQTSKSEFLEGKLGHVGKEVDSAFAEFSSVIQRRDDLIESQQKQVDELTNSNSKLCQDCKALQDKIETLEYVEDEMRSVQEQLSETEQSLQTAKNEESRLNIVTQDLKSQVDSLNEIIENQRSEYANLQEELDVSKAEAHFMIQQREEELGYGNSGLKHILTMMHELHSRLCGMIRPKLDNQCKNQSRGKMDHIDDVMMTPYVPPPKHSIVDTVLRPNICSDTREQNINIETSNSTVNKDAAMRRSSIQKDEDSITSRVDQGSEIFQSIINACAEVQLQFQKDIEDLEFRNSVLTKQLASMKEKLTGFNKEENELEQILRKRIDKLMKEGEEKSSKIEDTSRLLRMLSDQNMELAKYKVKYEELFGEAKSSRKHRQSKRRSSSAGSLKFLT